MGGDVRGRTKPQSVFVFISKKKRGLLVHVFQFGSRERRKRSIGSCESRQTINNRNLTLQYRIKTGQLTYAAVDHVPSPLPPVKALTPQSKQPAEVNTPPPCGQLAVMDARYAWQRDELALKSKVAVPQFGLSVIRVA